MRYYETLFIVHPNYEQDRLDSVIKSVEAHISGIGGHVLAVDDWGKRRLAYPIEKQKSGNYVLIYFEAEPSAVVELQKWLELQAQILAQLIVKLEEKPAGLPPHPKDDKDDKEDLSRESSIDDDDSDEDFDDDEKGVEEEGDKEDSDEENDDEDNNEDESEKPSEDALKETV